MTRWVAPTPTSPVSASLDVPGSKSATARALVLASLADAPSVLRGVLDARDTRLMRAALASFGVAFDEVDAGSLRVVPPAQFRAGLVDCGLAGTVMRFVPPIAALASGPTAFSGDAEALVRPMRPLLDGLFQVGVRLDRTESLPFTVDGYGRVPGGRATIDASGSSQFVSGLLLAAARFDSGLRLTHVGERVPSAPHIGLTLAMLRDRGVEAWAVPGQTSWVVEPGRISARDEVIEPDLINAATFLAVPLVAGGSVSVGWPTHTVQATDAILGTLEALGGRIERDADSVTVHGTGTITGADLDLTDAAELTCIAAALLAMADSPGSIRGVGHVRNHETDRLAALESELTARGAGVRQTADGLVVTPGPLTGGSFHTYADHRMAHAAALLGLRIEGVELTDVSATTKTIADFPLLWNQVVGG